MQHECDMHALYREDFKVFLREVRRNNKNTLSGLSLDSIAQQVKVIIEQRERKGGGASRAGGGGAVKPPGKGNSKTRAVEKKAVGGGGGVAPKVSSLS